MIKMGMTVDEIVRELNKWGFGFGFIFRPEPGEDVTRCKPLHKFTKAEIAWRATLADDRRIEYCDALFQKLNELSEEEWERVKTLLRLEE